MSGGIADVNKKDRPNIVYIILDDMGYSDLGCYGSEVKTPNVDKLAADGLLYNNFTVCPASSPTRASLLTGRENTAVGMGSIANVVLGPDRPTIQGRIKPEAATVAEILKDEGYNTYAVGKWHVAPIYHQTPAGPFDFWPLGKGFERFYGFLEGETDQYTPLLVRDNSFIEAPKKEDYHLSDDLVDHTIQFITDQVSVYPEKPFFLNLAFGVAHSPHQVKQSYIDMYKGVYDKGWDKIREERYNRQLQMGAIPEGAELSPKDPAVKEWDSLDDDHKQLYARFQETYAGFITHCDEQIGRFIKFLETIGELENTLIFLISDNGATQDGGNEGVDDFVRTLNGSIPSFEEMFERIDEIGGRSMMALYPRGWAHVSNTPFKQYKGTIFGGGTKTPLIVHWPDGIKTAGKICPQFVDVVDITPTVLDIAGIETPEFVKGVRQMPMHGESFAHMFSDAANPSKRTVKFYQWANSRGISHEGWKAIAIHAPGKSFEDDRWELYKTSEDFSESKNIAEIHPEKLQALINLWWAEAGKYGILPLREMKPADQGYIPLDSAANRSTFKYLPGLEHVGWLADPPIENKSYTISVPVFRSNESDEGVLVCNGDNLGGYTLYILGNRLIYEYNNFGTRFVIESEIEVPVGSSILKYEYGKTGPCTGIGSLYINDKKVGQTEMKTVPFALSMAYTDIGRDTSLPVSKNYASKGEFKFTGKIDSVTFELRQDPVDLAEGVLIKGGPFGG
jgi:arylsulfatase A-like enzyme